MGIIAVGLNFSESLRAGTICAAADNAKAALDLSEEQFCRPPCGDRPREILQIGAQCSVFNSRH